MCALKLESNSTRKKEIDRKCRAFLDQAEAMKTARRWSPNVPQKESHSMTTDIKKSDRGKTMHEPISKRPFSNREQIILLEGSKLNGFKFPPWKSPPDPLGFELQHGHPSFLYVSRSQKINTPLLLMLRLAMI